MRASLVVRLSLLLFAFNVTNFAAAQFQDPTPEELKMTSDPKAPGAAAVYLYREEIFDDAVGFHSYYSRIKVLTEKGKDLATVHIPYEHGAFKVANIQGRTIHSDGTIVPLTAKPTDLLDVKVANYQVNQMTFNLPSVEVGSILEYKLDVNYDNRFAISPTWNVQTELFTHKVHFAFKRVNLGITGFLTNHSGQVLNQLLWSITGLPATCVTHDAGVHYYLDLTDVPPTPTEDSMPPLSAINQKVEFYYTYAETGPQFWALANKDWTHDTERFTNPNGFFKKAAGTLVAPTDTPEQKARKIYAAVMALDNTDFSRTKSEAERKAEKLKTIRNSEDVWQQKSGTGDEIAKLYVALARAAALTVWPMQVVNRSRAIFDANLLTTSQLDDYIAILELNGQEVYLDPGQKMCPFGQLHWKHSMATGLRLGEKGAAIATTPAGTYNSAVTKRTADVQIDAQGNATGHLQIAMTGPSALQWRQLALQNDPEEVKKQFNEYIRPEVPDGVQADFEHFTGLDNPDLNLTAFVRISGAMGTATGKRFFLPGLFFESRGNLPFVKQDKRSTPIDVHYAAKTSDDVIYHLPPGYAFESIPPSTDLNWPDNAMLRIRSGSKDNVVEVVRTFAYNYSVLDAASYNDLRDFYLKVAGADQQQIVLTRVPEAKGN
jgi:hypothetical protein